MVDPPPLAQIVVDHGITDFSLLEGHSFLKELKRLRPDFSLGGDAGFDVPRNPPSTRIGQRKWGFHAGTDGINSWVLTSFPGWTVIGKSIHPFPITTPGNGI